MFSFIRRALRPIASIGQKIGEIFRIGRKAEAPMGVIKESVLVNKVPIKFNNITKFQETPTGSFLRPTDLMNNMGGFVGFGN
jgi:hypothetical protein